MSSEAKNAAAYLVYPTIIPMRRAALSGRSEFCSTSAAKLPSYGQATELSGLREVQCEGTGNSGR